MILRSRLGDIRFGSKADIGAGPRDVRFTPKSGHWNSVAKCPLCAKSGLMRCEKKCRYSIPLPSRQRDAAGFRTRGALDIKRPKDRLLFTVGRNQVYSAFSAWRRAVGVCRYGPRVAPPTSARADR